MENYSRSKPSEPSETTKQAPRTHSRITVSANDDFTPNKSPQFSRNISVGSSFENPGGVASGQRLGNGNNPGGSVTIGMATGKPFSAEEGYRLHGAGLAGGRPSFRGNGAERRIGSSGLHFSNRARWRLAILIILICAAAILLVGGISSCIAGS